MHFRFTFFYTLIGLFFFSLATANENGGSSGPFERMGPFGGDVRSLLIDSEKTNVAYLGSSNGVIFKSLDSGNSWMPLYPGIGRRSFVIDTLVQHPSEPDHIYAGAWDLRSEGGGLFESRDAGMHWTQVPLPQSSIAVRGLSICTRKPEYMIAGTLLGAYVTSDGGRKWRRVGGNDLQKAESVAMDPEDYRILYVGTWRLGYKSIDFGKTWIRLEQGMPLDSDVFSIAIDPRNPSIVYSSACSGVYRSVNKANPWKRLKLLPDRFTIRAHLAYPDPVNPGRVYSGTTEGLFVSNNDGQNWTRITPADVTVNAIQVDPANNRRILIGTEYDGVLLSEDGGRSWKESNTGFIHRRFSWILAEAGSSENLVAGMSSGRGGLFTFSSKTGQWTASQIEPKVRVFSFLKLPENRGRLAGTSQGLYWQPKDSVPWTKIKGSIGKRTVHSLELDPKHPVIYAGTDQGIYRAALSTLDFRLPPGYRLSPQVWCITAPDNETGVVYAGTSLGVLRSWDRGAIWNIISSYGLPGQAPITSIAVSPVDKNRIFAATSVGVYESSNGGVHWRRAGDNRMGVNISSVLFPDDSGNMILVADNESGGIFRSRDQGKSWDKISPESPVPVTCLARHPGDSSFVYVGTQGDGIYLLDIR